VKQGVIDKVIVVAKCMRVVDNGNFQNFGGYFFGNFRVEASVIMAICNLLLPVADL